MSEFTHQIKLVTLDCPTCGIIFAVPEDYRDRRYKDAQDFYCPNRHTLKYPIGITPRDLKNQLEAAEQRIAELNSEKTVLVGRLDQAEAALATTLEQQDDVAQDETDAS